MGARMRPIESLNEIREVLEDISRFMTNEGYDHILKKHPSESVEILMRDLGLHKLIDEEQNEKT